MANNILVILKQKVDEHPDKEAVVTYDAKLVRKALTFQEFWTLGARCASLLKEHGMKRYDNVLITVPLCLEYYVISFGIMMAGGVPVPMKKLQAQGKALAETVRLAETAMALFQAEDQDTTWDLLRHDIQVQKGTNNLVGSVQRSDMPLLKTAFLVRRRSAGNAQSFMDILKSRQDEYVDLELSPADGCCTVLSMNLEKMWCFKIVEISHRALMNMARNWAKKFPEAESLYFPYPWYAGLGIPYDTLCGWTRIMPDQWETGEHLDIQATMVGAYKVVNAVVGPQDVNHMLDTLKEERGPYMDTLVVGGGVLTEDIIARCRKVAKNVYVTYSTSECLYMTLQNIEKGAKFENFYAGKVEDNIQLKILDKQHEEVPVGEVGQIAVKSNTLYTRYLREPVMNRQAWTRDGWYLTNDAGYIR
ncbi:2,3-dihydroxybenzoate-amp ligase [Plakobranchus ocellatus]|uniref:2,3-dihydroxybenzoate-amp ligase n=1 Tax=Plakobranchus ocellatus TaxID=259542 RepID=A0AAV4D344_9GAST|nr:2,3-dihydroxybenzoate-amp ligase [Plakobranchus ocellatus]